MVKFSAFLSAVCLLAADSYRVAERASQPIDVSQWNFEAIRRGSDPTGPLCPALVPPANTTFNVQSRERADFIESNEYRWAFASIQQGEQTIPVEQWWATLNGGFFENLFGARRTEITNNQGQPIFVIEMNKYTWNPTLLSWSFRIKSAFTDEILFTLRKDWIGAGFVFMRDEWRIYRGRRRDGDQIYHIIGSYLGYGHRFYHQKAEWNRGMDPVAEASQSASRNYLGLPDVFSLAVHGGEDTCLLLAATVIIDMVHESEAAARRREATNSETQPDALLQEGSMETVWSEQAMRAA